MSCSVNGCPRTARVRGLCYTHYRLAYEGHTVDSWGEAVEMAPHRDRVDSPYCRCSSPVMRSIYGVARECSSCGKPLRDDVVHCAIGLVALTGGQSLAFAIVALIAVVVMLFGRYLDHDDVDDKRSRRRLLAELRRHDEVES